VTTSAEFDVTTLARALEARESATQLAAYARDAELVIIDRDNPPSRPRVITGTDALREYLDDFTSREMTHEVRASVASADHIAFELACQYPGAMHVHCRHHRRTHRLAAPGAGLGRLSTTAIGGASRHDGIDGGDGRSSIGRGIDRSCRPVRVGTPSQTRRPP
jgi:hypothetical protein